MLAHFFFPAATKNRNIVGGHRTRDISLKLSRIYLSATCVARCQSARVTVLPAHIVVAAGLRPACLST